MYNFFAAIALALPLIFSAGCGGADRATSPTHVTSARGTMTATIDGQPWSADDIYVATWDGTTFSLGGDADAAAVSMAADVKGPGTVVMDFNAPAYGLAVLGTQTTGYSNAEGGGGTLTVATLSSTHATGTFAFDLVATVGNTVQTKHVTNGHFDVDVNVDR